jgi:hypothetical protein
LPWWGYVLIAIPVLLVASLLIGWIAVTSFLRGDKFRKLVRDETNKALKAKGEFEQFSWDGTTAFSAGYTATGWEDGGYFERLAASTLRADVDLDGAKRGYWTVEKLDIGSLSLDLGNPGQKETAAREPGEEVQPTGPITPADQVVPPTGNEPRPDTAAQTATDHPESPTTQSLPIVANSEKTKTAKKKDDAPKKGNFWDKWLPSDLELKKVNVREARIAWAPLPEQAGQIAQTRMTLTPLEATDVAKGWQIDGSDGTFTQAGLAEFAIVDYSILAKSDEVFVKSAVLSGPKDSRLEAAGTIKLDPVVDADVRVEMTGYPLSEVLPEDWKKRLEGRLNGEVHVTGAPTSQDAVAEGHLAIQDGIVQGLPILEQIAKYTRTDRFLRLTLDQAEADFRRQGTVLEVKNLVMESRGLLKLTGGTTITGDEMDGTFRVGITSSSLQWLLGAEKNVFTESADGYLWTTMRVTGKVDAPKEDLTDRLILAFGKEIVSQVTGAAEKLKENADDNTKKVIDTVSGFLNSLIK